MPLLSPQIDTVASTSKSLLDFWHPKFNPVSSTLSSAAQDLPHHMAAPFSEVTPPSIIDIQRTLPDSIYQLVHISPARSASEIFSSGSTLNPQLIDNSYSPLSSDIYIGMSWLGVIFFSLTVCYYLYMLYRYWPNLQMTFRVSTSVSKTFLAYESRSNDQNAFELHTIVLTALVVLMCITGVAREFVDSNWLILPAVLGVLIFLILYQYTVIAICRSFSHDPLRMFNVQIIHRHHRSIQAILLTPLAISWAVYPQDYGAILVVFALLWIVLAIRLFSAFLRIGFGKLQWILYLCIVEIVPATLIWALSMRY